jgi:hypothetical protein
VRGFGDGRIRYIYQENRGLPAARNTGIRASSGHLLAFLDADDWCHPDRIQSQVMFLAEHSEVGLSYSSRFTVDGEGAILSLERAPSQVTLTDLVLSYPFTPSDVVVRREWLDRVGLYDESFVLNSEDLNLHLRLALAGCRFAGVQRALSYRRLHAGRVFRNLAGKMETFLRALDTAFEDPRCPPEVLGLRDKAYGHHYLGWAYQASVQGETALAHEYFRQLARLEPSLLGEEGAGLVRFFVHASTRDGGEHEAALRQVFSELPSELASLGGRCEWAVARGYLVRGMRDRMWGRIEPGRAHVAHAAELGAQVDETFLRELTDRLLNYEREFGPAALQTVLGDILPQLELLGSRAQVRWLQGCLAVNQAFADYNRGCYRCVPGGMVRAMAYNPRYVTDRGVVSTLVRSAWRAIPLPEMHKAAALVSREGKAG